MVSTFLPFSWKFLNGCTEITESTDQAHFQIWTLVTFWGHSQIIFELSITFAFEWWVDCYDSFILSDHLFCPFRLYFTGLTSIWPVKWPNKTKNNWRKIVSVINLRFQDNTTYICSLKKIKIVFGNLNGTGSDSDVHKIKSCSVLCFNLSYKAYLRASA